MKKPTQAQRQSYRARLIKLGVPEVYAHMAAENLTNSSSFEVDDAGNMIWCGFIWYDTQEGNEFWSAIARSSEYL